jgi:23S rRNA pseudouridine1911/1915/1917 synthase
LVANRGTQSRMNKQSFVVEPADIGLRLDQLLAKYIGGLSRRKARVAIDIGGVFIDNVRVKVAGRYCKPGQKIEVTLGAVLNNASGHVGSAARIQDEAHLPPYEVVFTDDDIVVVHKPAGLVTAPTPESDRSNLFDQLSRSGLGRMYLVHRIDLPTSGLLVFARTQEANKILGAAFVAHDIEREYRVVAVGQVADTLTIDRPVAKKPARTHLRVIERFANATLMAARLETGRTHQIRLHLAGEGHPVLGDHQHGGEAARTFLPRAPRMLLHAQVLGFAHPRTGTPMRFEREVPPEFAAWLVELRAREASATVVQTASAATTE